eukprot:1192407-Prorocentrum_minimum.AAC.2
MGSINRCKPSKNKLSPSLDHATSFYGSFCANLLFQHLFTVPHIVYLRGCERTRNTRAKAEALFVPAVEGSVCYTPRGITLPSGELSVGAPAVGLTGVASTDVDLTGGAIAGSGKAPASRACEDDTLAQLEALGWVQRITNKSSYFRFRLKTPGKGAQGE